VIITSLVIGPAIIALSQKYTRDDITLFIKIGVMGLRRNFLKKNPFLKKKFLISIHEKRL